MKRILTIFAITLFLYSTLFAQQAITLKVLPHHWSAKTTGKGRVKAELFGSDFSTVNTSTIMMNGIPAVRIQKTPIKLVAFFSKRAVLATLPAVQKGQSQIIAVTFNEGQSPLSLTDTIIISGNNTTTQTHSHGPTTQHGNPTGNGQSQTHIPTPGTHPGNPH